MDPLRRPRAVQLAPRDTEQRMWKRRPRSPGSLPRAPVGASIASATGHMVRDDRAAAPSLPPGLKHIDALSIDDAVAVAFWNSARFQVELARLGFSRADLAEAGALPNPVLSFLLPIGPRQLEASATYPIAALIQRPSRVAVAKDDVQHTAHALVEVGLDLARDVRLAHADAIVASRRLALRHDLEQTVGVISKLTEARLRAGDASSRRARREPKLSSLSTRRHARRATSTSPTSASVASWGLRRAHSATSLRSQNRGSTRESLHPRPRSLTRRSPLVLIFAAPRSPSRQPAIASAGRRRRSCSSSLGSISSRAVRAADHRHCFCRARSSRSRSSTGTRAAADVLRRR